MTKLYTLVLTCLAVIALYLMNACARSMPVAPTVVPSTPLPSITLHKCSVDQQAAECGSLSVLEDRSTPSGRRIEITVVVVKATKTHPAPDPIFWFAGGPGSAATNDVGYAKQLLGLAATERDLVFIDQRGTGSSNKLVCPLTAEPARQVEELRACLPTLKGDPSLYTTAWAVDDVDDVRAALGYDQINLYGGSYGATAAQVYLLRHQAHVRTVSLDSGSLLDVPMLERFPTSSQKALDHLFARCAADATCHSAFPNLRTEFAQVLARLESAPVTLPINDPSTGQPGVLTSATFRTTIHGALVSTATAVLVPRFIHLVYIQDWKALADLLAPFLVPPSEEPQWTMMNLTILCHEDWAKIRQSETTLASASSYLKYENVRALTVPEEICAAVPRPPPAALYEPVTSSLVPMLFINGEADPQDPADNLAGASQRYPNSLGLVARGQGHGFTGVPCRGSILADFIERGSVKGLVTECLDRVALPAFQK